MDKSIIIDGVDVSGCIYYRGDITANCGMFALGDFKCNEQICLYKRLKRLQQENKNYKTTLQEIKDYINSQGISNKWNMQIQRFRSEILQKISEVLGGN